MLPQAFCRVAAVGGAIYVLRRPLKGVIIGGEPRTSAQGHQGDAKLEDPAEGTGSSEAAEGEGGRRVTGVKTEDGQVLRCSALAGNPESLASLMQPSWTAEICPRAGWLSRCVAITDAPLQVGHGATELSNRCSHRTAKRVLFLVLGASRILPFVLRSALRAPLLPLRP